MTGLPEVHCREPEESSGRRSAARVGLALIVVGGMCAVFLTLDDPGVVWDEAIYLGMAARYGIYFEELGRRDWSEFDFDSMLAGYKERAAARHPLPWRCLSRPVVDFFWYAGQAHPPLGKLLITGCLAGFSGLLPSLRAARMAGALEFAVVLVCTFLLARRFFGRRAGLVSALLLLLMPRVFGHAHFAALDMPVVMAWMLTVTVFTASDSPAARFAAGAMFGLALLSKLNGALVILPIGLWAAWVFRRGAVRRLWPVIVVGLLVFLAGWPAMWFDFPRRLFGYFLSFHGRAEIPVYYFGKVQAPWHYPLVMTLFTVPAATLGFAAVGLFAGRCGGTTAGGGTDSAKGVLLAVLNLAVIFGSACSPFAPKYDGVRLFLPAFPFIACLAGAGFVSIWDRFGSRARRWAAGLALAVLLWQVVGIAMVHPFELAYYNALCGGCPGANKLGMETTYWGDTLDASALRALNERCAAGAKVAFFPVGSQVPRAHRLITGRLRPDIRAVDIGDDFDWLVLISRQGMFDDRAWHYFRNVEAVWAMYLQGVPVCMIFEGEDRKDGR